MFQYNVKEKLGTETGAACLGIISTWMLTHAKTIKHNIVSLYSDHLPLCQTPSLKRIYTKAHSLNLHLPDLHPESRGMATRRGGERQREDSSDRTAQTVHTKVMNL